MCCRAVLEKPRLNTADSHMCPGRESSHGAARVTGTASSQHYHPCTCGRASLSVCLSCGVEQQMLSLSIHGLPGKPSLQHVLLPQEQLHLLLTLLRLECGGLYSLSKRRQFLLVSHSRAPAHQGMPRARSPLRKGAQAWQDHTHVLKLGLQFSEGTQVMKPSMPAAKHQGCVCF